MAWGTTSRSSWATSAASSSSRTTRSASGSCASHRVRCRPPTGTPATTSSSTSTGDKIAAKSVPGYPSEYGDYIEAPVEQGHTVLPEPGQRRDRGERRRGAVPERARRVQGDRTRLMALLVGNVLRHAARYTPRRLAATLDDERDHVRRARRAGEPRRTHAGRNGRRARRPGGVVGRHVARGAADLLRAGEARRGVRAGERPARPGRGGRGRRVRAAAPRRRRRRARRPRPGDRRSDGDACASRGCGDARECSGRRRARARRARSARHLLHEWQHGPRRRASCSRTGPTACAAFRPSPPTATAGRCACSRCSTWPAGRWRSAAGSPAARSTSCAHPTPRRC